GDTTRVSHSRKTCLAVEVPLWAANVQLLWAPDLGLWIFASLAPLRNPSGQPADCKQHCEHASRKTPRLLNHAGVEGDVRVELALPEVIVFERDLLKLLRKREQWVIHAELCEHLLRALAHNARPRVVVFIDAVAKAHELHASFFVLHLFNKSLHALAALL